MFEILNLKDEPENLAKIASWHQDEWSYLNPGENLAARITRMQSHLNNEFIPSTFIAKDKTLLGSAAIISQDMKTHPPLTPWLASVFVRPKNRKQGIGRKLVSHVMSQARKKTYRHIVSLHPRTDELLFETRLDGSRQTSIQRQ